MVIAIILNLNLWIHKNFVCTLHGHENWAYFYVMEAKNGHFSVFIPPLIEVIFFSCAHQENFMIFEHNLPKFHQNLKNFYQIKFYDTLELESETSLIKSWSYEFSSLIDLKGIKKFIIASAKIFWPWRPGRPQSGREHFTFDCIIVSDVSYFTFHMVNVKRVVL